MYFSYFYGNTNTNRQSLLSIVEKNKLLATVFTPVVSAPLVFHVAIKKPLFETSSRQTCLSLWSGSKRSSTQGG